MNREITAPIAYPPGEDCVAVAVDGAAMISGIEIRIILF